MVRGIARQVKRVTPSDSFIPGGQSPLDLTHRGNWRKASAAQCAAGVDAERGAELLVEPDARILQRAAAFDAVDDVRGLSKALLPDDRIMADAFGRLERRPKPSGCAER